MLNARQMPRFARDFCHAARFAISSISSASANASGSATVGSDFVSSGSGMREHSRVNRVAQRREASAFESPFCCHRRPA